MPAILPTTYFGVYGIILAYGGRTLEFRLGFGVGFLLSVAGRILHEQLRSLVL